MSENAKKKDHDEEDDSTSDSEFEIGYYSSEDSDAGDDSSSDERGQQHHRGSRKKRVLLEAESLGASMSNVETVPLLWLEHAVETKDDAKFLYSKYFDNYGGNRTKRELLEAVLVKAIGDCRCYPDAIGDCDRYLDAIKAICKRREVTVGGTRAFIMQWASYHTPECVGWWDMDRCAEEIVSLTKREKAKTKTSGEQLTSSSSSSNSQPRKRSYSGSPKQQLRRERDEAQATARAKQEELDELEDEMEDELKAVYKKLEEVRQRLSEQDKEAMRKVQTQARNVNEEVKNIIRREGNIPPHGFMSRRQFKEVLRGLALMNEEDDLHVFHIIANSNGGPDHIDNFLWALGASFNISIGDRHDEFNCFLAGESKTRRAVEVCKLVESERWQNANPRLLRTFCRGRAGREFKFYSEGRHKWKTGENLYQKGQSVYGTAIRQAGR